MKTKLTLLLALLAFCVSGVWASTPNILALPQPGKIYYMAGYYDNSGSPLKVYLYSNNGSLSANVSYTENGDFAYLWLCAKSESGYTFRNLKSGTYLKGPGTQANPSLNATATIFDIVNDEVKNSDCVSLRTGTGSDSRWTAVNFTDGSPNRLDGSYNYTTVGGKNWTTDFLLIEYAAKNLSHNQYYYIYCDNDDSSSGSGAGTDKRQYLYNNNGVFAVQSTESNVTVSNYAWRTRKNNSNGKYTFCNNSKYLAFHTLSDDAFEWQTDKITAYETGRATLWGYKSDAAEDKTEGRYRLMLINYNDSYAGGISLTKSYSKANGAWSQDYMFVVAPQTGVYRVAIKIEGGSESDAVFTFDGIDYSGDCSIYVDNNNLPGTKNISLKSSSSEYTFKGFYLEDGTSLGTTIDVSSLLADKGVKAVFYPFKLSTDFANANWYYMTVNGEWAVTDDAAPYPMADTKQISKNALWAFVDDAGDGFYIINYASGNGMKLDMITPATMSSVDDYNKCDVLYENNNMYFYNDPSNHWYLINHATNHELTVSTSKDNGAITLEAVDWAELAKAVIDDYASTHALDEYFGASSTLVDATKALIDGYGSGFNKAMFEGTTADLSGLTKYPTSGFYRIYNSERSRYMGTETGTPMTLESATSPSTIVELVYDGVENTYKIKMQGLELDTPVLDELMSMSASGAEFTAEGTAGIAAFKVSDAYVHAGNSGNSYKLLGYDAPAVDAASGWTVTDATSVTLSLNKVGANTYGTTYLPFGVTLPTGEAAGNDVCAYTLTDNGNGWLTLNLLGADGKSIPAGKPVLLKGTSSTSVTATIAEVAAIDAENALNGTYVNIGHGNNLVLGKKDDVVGFYKYNFDIKANKAYIPAALEVKGLKLMDDDDATGIISIDNGQSTIDNAAIYNLAGQRLNKMQKGINIVNGKKVLK